MRVGTNQSQPNSQQTDMLLQMFFFLFFSFGEMKSFKTEKFYSTNEVQPQKVSDFHHALK